MTTTLNKIREHDPCRDGWEKLLRSLGKTKPDDEPIDLLHILDSNGLDDAMWCLRAVDGYEREIRLFAVWCARQVEHLMTDERSVNSLNVAERYANGEASIEELKAAYCAAWVAASDAASATESAAWAASAAWSTFDAASDAAHDAWDAWDAASSAAASAWDAARAAAWSANATAESAAWDAAYDAASHAASDAARGAAWNDARTAQREQFIKMCKENQ